MFGDGGEDGSAAVVEGAQALDLSLHLAELLFVEGAGHFFAVAGNERDGVAVVEQAHGSFDLGGFEFEGLGDEGGVIGHGVFLIYDSAGVQLAGELCGLYGSNFITGFICSKNKNKSEQLIFPGKYGKTGENLIC